VLESLNKEFKADSIGLLKTRNIAEDSEVVEAA